MSRAKGNAAEDTACEYLESRGYRIVERNFYSRYGEIDIIAYKDETLHFVEVKSGEGFEPIYNITRAKLNKIIKTVNYYIIKNAIHGPYVLDAIIIRATDIELVENLTL